MSGFFIYNTNMDIETYNFMKKVSLRLVLIMLANKTYIWEDWYTVVFERFSECEYEMYDLLETYHVENLDNINVTVRNGYMVYLDYKKNHVYYELYACNILNNNEKFKQDILTLEERMKDFLYAYFD